MMESLAIEDKIIRNKAFKALVRSKKEWLIKYALIPQHYYKIFFLST